MWAQMKMGGFDYSTPSCVCDVIVPYDVNYSLDGDSDFSNPKQQRSVMLGFLSRYICFPSQKKKVVFIICVLM